MSGLSVGRVPSGRGLVGVLQTWTRDLRYHPHLHFLVPGGGLSADGQHWLPSRANFLVRVEPLGVLFRAKFRDGLRKSGLFHQVPTAVWSQAWVVDCRPVGTGETALKYLAPYIFRIALPNNRILKLENEQVTFRYQEGESKRWRTATLAVFEFIRRFLQHVLPKGFVKVRSYGLLAAGNRQRLRLAQARLGAATQPSAATVTACELASPALQTLPCPRCGQPMLPIRRLPRQHRGLPRAPPSLAPLMPG
jgi:hypothetical protein